MRSLPRNWSRSVRTRSSIIQVLVAVQVITGLTLLLHSASFQLESILNSESILKAQMSSASGASTVHRRFACMGCTARRGEPTFSNDYQSAATHYSRSSHCNKSTRGIRAVTVQLNTRPQHGKFHFFSEIFLDSANFLRKSQIFSVHFLRK